MIAPDPKKAMKYEQKADKLYAKGKFRDALKLYQESEALASERIEIYQKLVATLNQLNDSWSEEDFSNSLSWTMREQELGNPKMKWVHEKLSAEYQSIQKLIQQLLIIAEPAAEERMKEQILGYGLKASLPLVDFILSLKKMLQQSMNESSPASDLNGDFEDPA